MNAYLSEHGLKATPISKAGDVLVADVTVEQANALLNTQYYTYESTDTAASTMRTLEYSIPTSLRDHITYIHPTTSWVL